MFFTFAFVKSMGRTLTSALTPFTPQMMDKPSVVVCYRQTCVKVRGKYAYWVKFAIVAILAYLAYRIVKANNLFIRIG